MVSQDTQQASNSNNHPTSSSNLHHFLISDPNTSHTHFGNPHFNAYGSDMNHIRVSSTTTFEDHSLGSAQFPNTVQSLGERMSRSINLVHDPNVAPSDDKSDIVHNTRHFMDLLGAPNEPNHCPNRLSLSLSSQGLQQPNSVQFRQRNMSPDFMQQAYSLVSSSGEETCNPGDYSFMGSSSFPAFCVGNSIYLKPAQSLLQEVIDLGVENIELINVKRLFLSSRGLCAELRAELLNNGFLSADKHDLQIKISKLVTLLEQVEGGYEEYCQRMEDLKSSFEMIAGEGAAKCYTALALQAMCRHFCSLREAIVTQIKLARKKLCPELPKIGNGLSQLCLFARDSRNGRLSLQQIGLIQGAQRQAWRPIRGLPETSVSILRAWLFEHFLHPYPNDSEKLILASQTGLTKNQVANWFINARVRLWKPMIEEMYKDEFGESSVDSSGEGVTDCAKE